MGEERERNVGELLKHVDSSQLFHASSLKMIEIIRIMCTTNDWILYCYSHILKLFKVIILSKKNKEKQMLF